MAHAAVDALRRLADSKTANLNNAPGGTFAGSITCALFLKRFVESAKLATRRYLWLDAERKARQTRGRRMPGRARVCKLLSERYG
jgi:leucyl aminopeptidase